MDRASYLAGLKLEQLGPDQLETFFRGLPSRLPGAATDDGAAALEAIGLRVAQLNAAMLGRELDTRLPRDPATLATGIADRMARWTSPDWSRPAGSATVLDLARSTVGEVSADLRIAEPADEDPWDDEWDEDPTEPG